MIQAMSGEAQAAAMRSKLVFLYGMLNAMGRKDGLPNKLGSDQKQREEQAARSSH